jgi:hypothetical protein
MTCELGLNLKIAQDSTQTVWNVVPPKDSAKRMVHVDGPHGELRFMGVGEKRRKKPVIDCEVSKHEAQKIKVPGVKIDSNAADRMALITYLWTHAWCAVRCGLPAWKR